ncbi:MAG: hypothetical protein KKC79_21175 [Gammaproteobacteria bacterium]|nr:hypothetical protein [Gammaproteobacteria bacterium]
MIKALAAKQQLLRFDLMSTVSGGGYVGAAIGKLCNDAKSADEVRGVEAAMGNVDRVRFGGWLRSNGRYLIPGGFRDVLFATALYLRNLLGTHIELAIVASLIGMVLAAINLLLWDVVFRAVDLNDASQLAGAGITHLSSVQSVRLLVQWATQWPTLWFTLVGPFIASIILACAYWSVRDKRSAPSLLLQAAMWLALGLAAWWVGPMLVENFGGPLWLTPAFVGFALCWILALLWVLLRSRTRSPAEVRNELTDRLASVVNAALLIVMLGLLDRSAWWLAAEGQEQRVSYGAALLVVAAALRGVLPMLLTQKQQLPGVGKSLLLVLASAVGLVLAFCLAAWWIGVVYAAVLLPVFTPDGLVFSRGWAWLGTIAVVVGSYAIVTGRNFAFLNISSLHMFYKARIVRGYLGAANSKRLGGRPTESMSGLEPPRVPVGEVDSGDDFPQHGYAPHAQGGPVHLVNVCINQTHDTKQRLFNRDRKSLPFTIGPRGWMQAAGADWVQANGDAAQSLGAWTAISGAAFAPGLGHLTRRGISALTVFAGLRLGYWWNSADAGVVQRGAAVRSSPWLMKSRFLLLECFGAFPGSSSASWYLSDGGHFENTGAYALLRQEASLIVIADCGADPEYRFCDLENLVRRARIDLNAEITFMKPAPGADWDRLEAFGSLNDLASFSSQACLAMAQVRYASGASGQILLVKPNVSATLPVDLVNFKAANPLFPQQPTTDQFFDEAQWESYFLLGSEIGGRIDGQVLDRIASGAAGLFVPDDGQPRQVKATDKEAGAAVKAAPVAATPLSRLQARVMQSGAVTASVGIGTAATLGVAAWQGIDTWRAQRAATEQAENGAFKELTERWARLQAGPATGEGASTLAAELLRTGDLLCREGGSENFMTKFRLSVRIVDDAKEACASQPTERRAPACVRLLDTGNGIDCLQPPQPSACAPRYWARDYSGQTGSKQNCSGILPTPWPVVVWLHDRFTGVTSEGGPAVVASAPPPALPPYAMPTPSAAVPGSGGAGSPSVVPTPAPATVSPPSLPPIRPGVCRQMVVYIQIYGPAMSAAAESWKAPWRALGASVPPVEDLLRTSRVAGRSLPIGHAEPSIVIRDESARACASALARTAPSPTGQPWVIKLLPRAIKSAPGAIEVWLPRER